jgi:hypothetical protein
MAADESSVPHEPTIEERVVTLSIKLELLERRVDELWKAVIEMAKQLPESKR